MTNEDKAYLEKLIDSDGVHGVAYAMADICIEKADHVRSNYQDKRIAKEWEFLHRRVMKFADGLSK